MKFLRIFLLLSIAPFILSAQKTAPANWFNLDFKTDKIMGISTEKAYKELGIVNKGNKIIVAVIDGGTDISHEDLKNNIWQNSQEVPNNLVDEDGNGYIDDVNGWNYIGGKEQNVLEDTYEITRIMHSYEEKGFPLEATPPFLDPYGKEARQYKLAKELYLKQLASIKSQKASFDTLMSTIDRLVKQTRNINPDPEKVKALEVNTKKEKYAKSLLLFIAQTGGLFSSPIMGQLKASETQINNTLNYQLNLNFDPRFIVGDNYADLKESKYGNSQVMGPKAEHGTHVAGIIAANRENETGIRGICSEALIMVIRVVPDGDERDKDVANAIRYAVDNGAKVINMSFGKPLSPNKAEVDLAVKYALSKDVLIIHAAGNDAKNLEIDSNYPNPRFEVVDYTAQNWIEVGASSWEKGKRMVAPFSNYGRMKVDVFAPGVDINSCIPDNKYATFSGTSMAAPVVAGLAALIRQNFPQLTALQTKQIIMLSVVAYKKKVFIPGSKKKTRLSELCRTGGIVNAYQALLMAKKVAKGEIRL